MECNKEEAIRAKDIAESKMQNKDFQGARKMVLKAQQLHKDLENISQMLMVCEVHCSSERRMFGNEMDWYGILQIEQTADEAMIKKQYRKFALQLHPDKNKFPGAEAAFKLIQEAQRVLLDKEKRSLHDIKRKAAISKPAPPYRPPQRANFGAQNNFRSNFTGVNPQRHQVRQPAAQQGFSNFRPTFWTACPFCNVKYQYYIEVINKSIICQNCAKSFVAYERSMQGVPTATNLNQPPFPQRKDVPDHGACKVELGHQTNFTAEPSKTEFFSQKCYSSDFVSEKVNGKRRRKQGKESSESCDADGSTDTDEESCDIDGSTDTDEDMVIDEDGNFKAGQNFKYKEGCPRRSDRLKQQVSYKENLSDDDDFVSHPKKAKGSGSSCATKVGSDGSKEDASKTNKQSGLAPDVKNQTKVKQEESPYRVPNESKETKKAKENEKDETNGCQKGSEAHVDSALDPELFEYPDPDFNDFDKVRNEDSFSVGQIWALYDTLDAMPRFYARIRKVFPSGFKLRITWLEPDPDNEKEIEWVNEGLPASCGELKNGYTENTEDRLMFSHLVYWERGSRKDTYKIFPRKGEIWALFKNWDIKWKSDADTNRKFEYEFVEILSEYTEGVGAHVAYLGKVKGFVSVFCRIGKEQSDSFLIPPSEKLRFSHMIPSFKLTGEERKCVPKGSFELDPASLPKNIAEIDVPKDKGVEVGNNHSNGSCSRSSSDKVKAEVMFEARTSTHQADMKKAHVESENDHVNDMEDRNAASASTPEAIEIPDPEFFNFDAEKSVEKFQVGQIWSLYSDEEGLPKYYGQIMKIRLDKGFKLRLRWLSPCTLPNNMIQWHDKDMPVGCGRFKIKMSGSQSYTSTSPFSHQVIAEPAGKKNEYIILPRKGEVWALYRNWSAELKHSNLENCEYDTVEVLEENDLFIKVLFLEQVGGLSSIFKAQVRGGSAVTREVLQVELLRFSHQIPAFRLTEQRGGSLRGFWELDLAALPVNYFANN